MKLKANILAAAFALGVAGTATANPVLTDLTTSDYITVGLLDWAWASPVTSANYANGYNVLSAASLHTGWREATDVEWAAKPVYTDFGGKCAAKYWNSKFTHCDFGDRLSQHLTFGGSNSADLWYVRDVVSASVPEPGTLALLGLAFAGLAATRRKQKKA